MLTEEKNYVSSLIFLIPLVFAILHQSADADSEVGLFPPPLSGWTADEVKIEKKKEVMPDLELPFVARTILKREYRGPDGVRMMVTIDTFDCLGAAMITAGHEKQIEFDPKLLKPITYGPKRAMVGYDSAGHQEIIAVEVDKCVVLTLAGLGDQLPTPSAMEAYLKRVDLSRIEDYARRP